MPRDKRADCEPKPQVGGSRPEAGEQKTEDGNQVPVTDSQSADRESAVSNEHTCCHCAYACRMRRGPSFLMGMHLRRPLVCLNHAEAPGEFREVLGNSTCPNFRARREAPLRVPPPEPPNEKVKFIILTKGQHAMVDAADFDWLNDYKWHAARSSSGRGYYASPVGERQPHLHAPPDHERAGRCAGGP